MPRAVGIRVGLNKPLDLDTGLGPLVVVHQGVDLVDKLVDTVVSHSVMLLIGLGP